MKVLAVVTHPRTSSLTFAVANHFVQGLEDAGHEVEVLDLYRRGFNPVLWEADEPDWSADEQQFSPEVETEIERLKRHDALAFIFPLWWWSMPAMLGVYRSRMELWSCIRSKQVSSSTCIVAEFGRSRL